MENSSRSNRLLSWTIPAALAAIIVGLAIWFFVARLRQDVAVLPNGNGGGGAIDGGSTPLPLLAPDQVVVLGAVSQQLADIDAWVLTQFKQSAWERAGRGLHIYLAKASENPDGFAVAVEKLRAERFRPCVDPGEYKAFRDELERLKNDPAVSASNPVRLSEDVVETVAVLEAAYLGLADESVKWESGKVTPDEAAAAVVRGLQRYQTMHRRIGKVRLLLEQPAWVHDLLGDDGKQALADARAVLAEIDARLVAADLTNPDPSRLPGPADLNTLRARDARLAAASAKLTGWFNSSSAAIARQKDEWVRRVSRSSVEIPADAAAAGRPYLRAALTPEPHGRFRADLYLCRPAAPGSTATVDPELVKAFNPNPPQAQPTAPERLVDEIELGISLAVVFDGESLVLPPGGLGGNQKVDSPRLIAALRRLGLPPQLGLDRVDAIVAPDLRSVTVSYSVSIPGVPRSADGTVTIRPAGMDASLPLSAILTGELVRMRDELVAALRGQTIELPTPIGAIKAANWQAAGNWAAGSLGFSVDLTCGKYGTWTVPLEFTNNNGKWALRPGVHAVPGRILDALLSDVRATVGNGLASVPKEASDKVADIAARIPKQIAITSSAFDPVRGELLVELGWVDKELLGGGSLPSLKMRLGLASGRPIFEGTDPAALRSAVNNLVPQIAKALVARLTGDLTAGFVAELKGKKFGLFGQSVEITDVGGYDEARRGVRVDARVTVAGRGMSVRGVWLLTGKPSGPIDLEGVRADFGEVTTDPVLDVFLRDLFRTAVEVPSDVVQVSGIRAGPDGFRATIALDCKALGGPLPLGEITFGVGKVGVAPPGLDVITTELGKRLTAQLAGKLTIPDLGPVTALAIDEAHPIDLKMPRIFLRGKLALDGVEGISVPFTGVQVFPSLDLSSLKVQPPTDAVIQKFLKEVLPLPENSPISIRNVQVKTEAPYGVTFDLRVNVLVFGIEVGKVGITQRGLDLPERIAVRFPGFIAIGPLAIVNPGVGIYLKDAAKIDILGDLTFASQGVDLILAVRCTMTADLRKLQFKMNGTLVLLSLLPIFTVDGDVDLKAGMVHASARTLPPIDKVLDVQGKLVIDGPALAARSSAHLRVLGMELVSVDMEINARKMHLRFDGGVKLLIAEMKIHVELSPDLARMNAGATFNLSVGGFDIAGASLDVTPARTMLQCRVMGFKITVYVSTVSCLTPKIVLDVILSLFDFDPIGFFKALAKREVVVNLIDSKGKKTDGSVGQGQPIPEGPPPDDKAKPPESGKPGENQTPPPAQPGTTPASDHREPGPAQPTGGLPGGPAGGWPAPPGQDSRDNRPSEVVTYKVGTHTIKYIADPKGSGKLIEVTTAEDGKTAWESHFVIEPAVVNQLKDPQKNPAPMILYCTWVSIPSSAGVRCRNNYVHRGVPVYLVLEKGGLFVAGMYPGGTYVPMGVGTDVVGPGLPVDAIWDAILKRGERPFTDGDFGMLAEFARGKVDPAVGVATPRRLRAAGDKRDEDGYVYVVTAGGTKEAVYRSRKGPEFRIREGTPLFPALSDANSPLAAGLGNYLTRVAAVNERVSLLTVDSAAPPRRAVFVRADSKGTIKADALDATLGEKSVSLLGGPSPYRGSPDPAWPPSQFATKFGDAVASGKWHEARLGTTPRRAAFVSDVDKPGWAVQVLVESNAPATDATARDASGTAITAQYKTWLTISGNVLGKGSESFGDFSTADQRRRLMDVLIAPDRVWPEYFGVHPLGLFVKP